VVLRPRVLDGHLKEPHSAEAAVDELNVQDLLDEKRDRDLSMEVEVADRLDGHVHHDVNRRVLRSGATSLLPLGSHRSTGLWAFRPGNSPRSPFSCSEAGAP